MCKCEYTTIKTIIKNKYTTTIGNSSSKQQQQKSAVRNTNAKKYANKYENKTQRPAHGIITN